MSLKPAEEVKPFNKFGLSKKFVIRVKRMAEVQKQIHDLEAEKKDLQGELAVEMISCEAELCMVDDYRTRLCSGGNATIDKTLLLKNGVGVDVIEASTKRTSYKYVKVTPPKGAEDE